MPQTGNPEALFGFLGHFRLPEAFPVMSPTSYQAAPPRRTILCVGVGAVKSRRQRVAC
jgi:hypothetical protein